MNGAILDFNLLLGKVAGGWFHFIFSRSEKVLVLCGLVVVTLVWDDLFVCFFFFLLFFFLCGFLIGFMDDTNKQTKKVGK